MVADISGQLAAALDGYHINFTERLTLPDLISLIKCLPGSPDFDHDDDDEAAADRHSKAFPADVGVDEVSWTTSPQGRKAKYEKTSMGCEASVDLLIGGGGEDGLGSARRGIEV